MPQPAEQGAGATPIAPIRASAASRLPMTATTDSVTGQVALLVDFENLVRNVDEEDIDCEAVYRLADEYGRVLVANAYADWRLPDVNQHQTDLYALGIELVHVLGRRHGALVKNAVDVKMAVDAVSLISSLPHIDVYVIVSGDRDFIHVLKELRRHGKTVIGMSPNSAVSKDFAGLCDRFVQYEALISTAEPIEAESIDEVRSKLVDIVRENPNGMPGGAAKTMLRRVLSSTFDESTYGFKSFSAFLEQMKDVVRVVPAPASGGDLRVYPARESALGQAERLPVEIDALIRQAKLNKLRYERNAVQRRKTLSELFAFIAEDYRPSFTLLGLHESMRDGAGNTAMSLTDFMKYARILYLGRAFAVEPGQNDTVLRERRLSLAEGIRTPEDLVLCYETPVAVRLLRALDDPVDAAQLAVVLGLDSASAGDLSYCEGLLQRARHMAASFDESTVADPSEQVGSTSPEPARSTADP